MVFVCCCPQNEDLEQAFSVYQSNKDVLLKEVEERGQRLEQEQQEKEDMKKVRCEAGLGEMHTDTKLVLHTCRP